MIAPDSILNAVLALAAAATWGTGDFVGGSASRRTSALNVLLVAQLTGLFGMTLLAWITQESLPSARIITWSLAAGTANVVGFVAFYRALSVGKMGINAPVTAVITAGIPVAYSFATEGLPKNVQFAGFVVALVGIWMLAKPDSTGLRSKGLSLAVIAGVFFASFLILMKVAGQFTTGWPLATARLAGVVVAGSLVLSQHVRKWLRRSSNDVRTGLRPVHRAGLNVVFVLAILAGLLDSGGTIFYLPAARHGRLDVAVVLSSLYPVTTVILARLFLKERLTPIQAAGVVAALIAVPMIAS